MPIVWRDQSCLSSDRGFLVDVGGDRGRGGRAYGGKGGPVVEVDEHRGIRLRKCHIPAEHFEPDGACRRENQLLQLFLGDVDGRFFSWYAADPGQVDISEEKLKELVFLGDVDL